MEEDGRPRPIAKNDPSPLFMIPETEENPNGPPREGGRYYKDRFVNSMSPCYLREKPLSDPPFCYIDYKWSRNIEDQHGNCHSEAKPRWGPTKVQIPGSRTLRHLTAEDPNDYLAVDCYRRPPTNQPEEIFFDYGRPHAGYYSEKNPSDTTWSGASIRLNDQQVVPMTVRKTVAEYKEIDSNIHDALEARIGMWPEWSEYTDKYVMHNETQRGKRKLEHWLTDEHESKASTQSKRNDGG